MRPPPKPQAHTYAGTQARTHPCGPAAAQCRYAWRMCSLSSRCPSAARAARVAALRGVLAVCAVGSEAHSCANAPSGRVACVYARQGGSASCWVRSRVEALLMVVHQAACPGGMWHIGKQQRPAGHAARTPRCAPCLPLPAESSARAGHAPTHLRAQPQLPLAPTTRARRPRPQPPQEVIRVTSRCPCPHCPGAAPPALQERAIGGSSSARVGRRAGARGLACGWGERVSST